MLAETPFTKSNDNFLMIKIYGIPNCDSTRKAMAWLKKNKTGFAFHNYKTQGIEKARLVSWIKVGGLEKLLNKKSTTWRQLPETLQATAINTEGAIQLMLQYNSLIKRPIIEKERQLLIGFNDQEYKNANFNKEN